MKTNVKTMLLMIICTLLILLIGLSYAFFTLEIEGTGKDVIVSTGNLRLEYKDEAELKFDNAFPGDSITKVITVTNVGTLNASYSLYLGNLINTIEKNELSISLECKSYTNYNESTKTISGTCNGGKKTIPVSETLSSMTIKDGISIVPGITHEYTVTVTFEDTSKEQNYNKSKKFSGQIGIGESTLPKPVYCTFDGELTQGATYINEGYIYSYMQEYYMDPDTNKFTFKNIVDDGWGVTLIDKENTTPDTGKVCTYINNKPVVSMSYMFSNSQATTLDVSNFNTSNVTNMSNMFFASQATTINGLKKLDTSNVTNMYGMFYASQATTLDLSNFDTSNVTNMTAMFLSTTKLDSLDLSSFDTSNVTDMFYMFGVSGITSIDLSNFDTSNVTNMRSMFAGSNISTLDLSNFNTSNVTDMGYMFYGLNVNTLDLSNFNTSNVTAMDSMFEESHLSSIDLNNFDTSNVTSMSGMFYNSQATTLNLSSFDTSKVTNMSNMFRNCSKLNRIYASDKFVTTNVTNDNYMFYGSSSLMGGSGSLYSSSKIGKTYAHIDGGTSSPGYFTEKN